MSKRLIAFLKTFLGIGIAGLLLFFVFKNVNWIDFWNKARTVNYSWVFVSMALSSVAYVARAYRWNILLQPLGYHLKTSRTTVAVLIGYLANLALPRLGEITRCGVLNRNDGVPVSVALGTVVTDRLMDILVLFILIGLSLFIESERLVQFLMEAYSDLNIPVWSLMLMLTLVMLGVLGLIMFMRHQDRLKGKPAELIKGFVMGFISLKDIKNPMGFIASTMLLWVIYYVMSYVIIFALPETSHLDFGAGLMLLVTGGIALSLPVQSGFGTYHGMVAGMLLLYAIDKDTGIFLATLLHTSQVVALVLFGTIATIISFSIRRKTGDSNQK